MVLPARGGLTINARCPLPSGVKRSITRVVSGLLLSASQFASAVRRIANEPPPRLWVHRPDAPDSLDALLLRAMASDPRDRPAPKAFARELRAILPEVMMPPAPPNDSV